MAATTKTITTFTPTGVRTNVDGSQVLIADVVYSDASTGTIEVPVQYQK